MNISMVQDLIEKDGIVFLTYGGSLTQTLIAGMTEALENEAKFNDLNMSTSNNIFTIFIELAQNMMNYSKKNHENENGRKSEGLILVGKSTNNEYFIHSQNVVNSKDMHSIQKKLELIKNMDKETIKSEYRRLRKEGRDLHPLGAGIGFYEISKRCDEIDFEFKKVDENRFYFHFKAKITEKVEVN